MLQCSLAEFDSVLGHAWSVLARWSKSPDLGEMWWQNPDTGFSYRCNKRRDNYEIALGILMEMSTISYLIWSFGTSANSSSYGVNDN
jgi:hypothetical protein